MKQQLGLTNVLPFKAATIGLTPVSLSVILGVLGGERLLLVVAFAANGLSRFVRRRVVRKYIGQRSVNVENLPELYIVLFEYRRNSNSLRLM